jgi:palmitoyltransferase ZDHHC9/14/18
MPKLYNIWPGRNRFLPCGCIFGPIADSCANLYAYACFITALIPYCIFILPTVWNINPAIPILLLLAVSCTILFLNLTQCTDPGIIPRRPYLERQADRYERYLLEILPGEDPNKKKRRFC